MTSKTILAIDASADACSVALQVNGEQSSLVNNEARAHAQSLLPLVDQILSESSILLNDVDAIAVVHGPGSFTGIRIAISVAQGLAYGAKLPVVCLSSLEVMAVTATGSEAFTANPESIIVPALDARMGEVYWAAFALQGGQLYTIDGPAVAGFHSFAQDLDGLARKAPLICAGNGYQVDGLDISPSTLENVIEKDVACTPSASGLLAALDMCEGQVFSACDLEPLYLRNEVAWKKRKRLRESTD